MLCSLVTDGVCGGVGAVIGFLPTIVTLFFFLSILEDSGYMARVAFVMDKPLRRLAFRDAASCRCLWALAARFRLLCRRAPSQASATAK